MLPWSTLGTWKLEYKTPTHYRNLSSQYDWLSCYGHSRFKIFLEGQVLFTNFILLVSSWVFRLEYHIVHIEVWLSSHCILCFCLYNFNYLEMFYISTFLLFSCTSSKSFVTWHNYFFVVSLQTHAINGISILNFINGLRLTCIN